MTKTTNITGKTTASYAESREAANEDFGTTMPVHKLPFKVMVWTEITFNGVAAIVILSQMTTVDEAFYIENILPIVKRDLISPFNKTDPDLTQAK